MKYCDDINCPHFNLDADETDCELGFDNPFILPKSMADIYPEKNWGYRMPKVCRDKFKAEPRQVVRDK